MKKIEEQKGAIERINEAHYFGLFSSFVFFLEVVLNHVYEVSIVTLSFDWKENVKIGQMSLILIAFASSRYLICSFILRLMRDLRIDKVFTFWEKIAEAYNEARFGKSDPYIVHKDPSFVSVHEVFPYAINYERKILANQCEALKRKFENAYHFKDSCF
mgnify:CR=1 FL=1